MQGPYDVLPRASMKTTPATSCTTKVGAKTHPTPEVRASVADGSAPGLGEDDITELGEADGDGEDEAGDDAKEGDGDGEGDSTGLGEGDGDGEDEAKAAR